jgi:hypothetical protein
VFLRVLEYYAGVLFLTTNRVGGFDEAFTSRIHVSLYYPELSKDKTVEVFKINMNMINERFEAKERTIVIDDIITFASDHYNNHPLARWNARQIRNACQTALALAEFEAQGNNTETVLKPNALVHLKVSHFQTVQKAYLEFAEYMNSLYGTTSSTRAEENTIRAIWIDENDNVVGTQSMGGAFKLRQEAFLLASQGQQQSRSAQPQPQAQQVFQQEVPVQAQQGFQQQAIPMVNQGIPNPGVQQYYQYPNVVAPQPMYTQDQVRCRCSRRNSFLRTSSGVAQERMSSRAPPLDKEKDRTELHHSYHRQRRPRHNSRHRPIQPGSSRIFKPFMQRPTQQAQNKGHRTACLQQLEQQEADTHQGHLLQARNGRDLKAQPVIANRLTNSHSLILSR